MLINIEMVSLERLLQAIKVHGKDNGAGFYLIEPMQKNEIRKKLKSHFIM